MSVPSITPAGVQCQTLFFLEKTTKHVNLNMQTAKELQKPECEETDFFQRQNQNRKVMKASGWALVCKVLLSTI